MQIKSIKREVLKNDGVIITENENKLVAMCKGYDIEFVGGVLTMRLVSKRGTYDAGSDYNPGNYMFLNKVKLISEYLNN